MATTMCATLYAVGSYTTSFIESPWGVGQFRPAVIIPSLFAVIFGSVPAGVGAALGTLIADSVKHGYLYPGSYLASVPGNFIGFFLFGYIVKKFNWSRFILASHITLTLANFIVAVLYVLVYKIMYANDPKYLAFSSQALIVYILGLTIWWFVTMLPFVLLVTPVLIRAVAYATPSVVPEDVRIHGLNEELPEKTFSMAILIPGLVMLTVGLLLQFTSLGSQMDSFFGSVTFTLILWMFYISGAALTLIGLFVRLKGFKK